MKCPHCGNQTQEDAIFCDQCGQKLPKGGLEGDSAQQAVSETSSAVATIQAQSAAPEIVCPSCGASATPGEMFCNECGAPLEAPQPESTVQAPSPAAVASLAGEEKSVAGEATCPACGAAVSGSDAFCFACGAALSPAQEGAPATMPPGPVAAETPSVAESQMPEGASLAAPASTPTKECPACGARVGPDDAFCDFCGAALVGAAAVTTQAAMPQPPAPDHVAQAPTVGARLVLVDSGVEFPLQGGKETLVGREDPYSGIFPDVDLTPYGAEEAGVSRRHFRIAIVAKQYTIEDMNSTNFTLVNQQRIDPGKAVPLKDGDEIRAGRLRLRFKAGS